MVLTSRRLAFATVATLGIAALASCAPAVRAQTIYNWTGYSYLSGNPNTNWSVGSNWGNNTPPLSGSTIMLSFGASPLASSNNDYSGGLTLNRLNLSGPTAYSFTGNALNFAANGTTQPSIGLNATSSSNAANALNWSGSTLNLAGSGNGGLNLSGVLTSSTSGTTTAGLTINETGGGPIALTGVGSSITGYLRLTNGTLTLSTGGTLSSGGAFLGDTTGGVGTMNVTGSNTTWTNSPVMYVGYNGVATLNVKSGATVNNSSGFIGYNAAGTVSVDGSGSIWRNTGTLLLGYNAAGALSISNGGQVTDTNAVLGEYSPNGSGHVTVTGTNSAWYNSGTLTIGESSSAGRLDIQNGAIVSDTTGSVGNYSGATGLVAMSGGTWTNTNGLTVGANGTVTVYDGSKLSVTGNGLDSGTMTVSGTGSSWTNTGNIGVGVGGALTVSAGGSVSDANSSFSSTSGTTITGTGTTWSDSDSLLLTSSSSGGALLNVSSGAKGATTNGVVIGSGDGQAGTLNLDGTGTSWTAGYVQIGDTGGSGTLNITNGATLSAGEVQVGVEGGSGTLNITHGATLVAYSAELGDSIQSESSVGTISVDGSGSLLSLLSLDVGGDGYNVGKNVTGALNLTNGGAASVGSVEINTGSTLNASGGSLTTTVLRDGPDGGGTVKLSGSGLTLNQSGDSAFSGAIQDGTSSGSLVKTGSGTLTLTGPNTYSGGTTVTGGTLALNSAAADGSGALKVGNGATVSVGISNALGGGAVTLNGGTLAATASNVSVSGSALTLTGGGISYIDFGAGNSNVSFNFADSSGSNWDGTLYILNDPDGDILNITGLTPAQLASIFFVNPDGMTGTFAATSSTGGQVSYAGSPSGAAAPEPGSLPLLLLAALPLLSAKGGSRRRALAQHA